MALLPIYDRKRNVVDHATVDDDVLDWCSQWTWHIKKGPSQKRYACRWETDNGVQVTVLLHRELLDLPRHSSGIEADHIDGDSLNNRRVNLREATHAQNHQNRKSVTGATSAYRGVHWSTRNRKWRATAKINGQRYELGLFSDELEAARSVSVWRQEHMPYAVEQAI